MLVAGLWVSVTATGHRGDWSVPSVSSIPSVPSQKMHNRQVFGARFPRDSASGKSLPPPSVGLSFASAERASPRSKSWKIEAPPPSRPEKRRHPVVTYPSPGVDTPYFSFTNTALFPASSPAPFSEMSGSVRKMRSGRAVPETRIVSLTAIARRRARALRSSLVTRTLPMR